jgi:integrase
VDSIFRRKSGVYFARLVVPSRLRQILARTELIATTGVRDVVLAKIVGAEILNSWRRRFLELDRVPMDIVQLKIGSPKLAQPGFLSLREAAAASGLDTDFLLDSASQRRLRLYYQPGQLHGYAIPYKDLEPEGQEPGFVVPLPADMPSSARPLPAVGMLRLSAQDVPLIATDLAAGKSCRLMLFEFPSNPSEAFAPSGGAEVSLDNLAAAVAEIESLRRSLAATITDEQLAEARARQVAAPANKKGTKRISEAVVAYMAEREKSCNPDQARRIRAACDLFVELMADPRLCDVDRDAVRLYRDKLLPAVPSHENKVRLQLRTTSIRESINAVSGTTWPRISAGERAKRMQWVCGMFEWLLQEKWIADDPAVGLGTVHRGRKGSAEHTKRELFTRDDLKKVFGAPWFATGRGELTKAGTYREFLPYYYWLPLLGLFTGARINELCQLSLKDIRQTKTGVWFIDINEEDESGKKKVKNASSVRHVPLHSLLIRCGLIQWRDRLEADGHDRLFPEFSHDETKGYSKAAVKWFSNYLRRLGWERNGRKVFHSFRHTLASECLNNLGLSEALTAQISGHKRSQSVLGATYRKDVVPHEVVVSVSRLGFGLPPIAVFDIDAGLTALEHATDRKDRRGSAMGRPGK